MGFSKLYSVVPDGAIGFQTVNQAGDNNAELRTQMRAEHGTREPGSPGALSRTGAPDYASLGRHNLLEIPRTVAGVALYLAPGGTVGAQLGWSGVGINSCWRIGAGQYLLHVVGLSTFWAIPCHYVGSSVTAVPPQVRPFYASAANNNNAGLWVSTYKLDSGDFIADDQAFSFALYGTP